MELNTANSLKNLIIMTTLSTSVMSAYDAQLLVPEKNYSEPDRIDDVADMMDTVFDQPPQYTYHDENQSRFQAVEDFARKVHANTKDIDNEFVEVVNENFWDII